MAIPSVVTKALAVQYIFQTSINWNLEGSSWVWPQPPNIFTGHSGLWWSTIKSSLIFPHMTLLATMLHHNSRLGYARLTNWSPHPHPPPICKFIYLSGVKLYNVHVFLNYLTTQVIILISTKANFLQQLMWQKLCNNQPVEIFKCRFKCLISQCIVTAN